MLSAHTALRRSIARVLAACLLLATLQCGSEARGLVPPDAALFRPALDVTLVNTLRTNGVPVSQGFFGDLTKGVVRSSACQLPRSMSFPDENGNRYPSNALFDCEDDPADANVCLTRDEVEAAFNGHPEVLSSLYLRYDLPPVHIESQLSNGNQFTTQVFNILAQEVGGYRVKHTMNTALNTNLYRCTAEEIDFHLELVAHRLQRGRVERRVPRHRSRSAAGVQLRHQRYHSVQRVVDGHVQRDRRGKQLAHKRPTDLTRLLA